MKKSEIIALIEKSAIDEHDSAITWFGYSKKAETEDLAEMYHRFYNEHYHRSSAMLDLIDKITGIEGHAVMLDENCEYAITVL